MSFNRVMIYSDEGVVVLGQRGSGKSKLLERISYVFPRIVVYDPLMQHGGLGQIVSSPELLEKALRLDVARIVYQPEIESEESFDKACELVYLKGYYCFAADEIDLYVTKHVLPTWFGELIKRGRNYGCGFVIVSRRTAEVNNHAIAFANHLFLFYHHLNADIDYLKQWIGEDLARQVKAFPGHYFLYYHLEYPNETFVCEPLRI